MYSVHLNVCHLRFAVYMYTYLKYILLCTYIYVSINLYMCIYMYILYRYMYYTYMYMYICICICFYTYCHLLVCEGNLRSVCCGQLVQSYAARWCLIMSEYIPISNIYVCIYTYFVLAFSSMRVESRQCVFCVLWAVRRIIMQHVDVTNFEWIHSNLEYIRMYLYVFCIGVFQCACGIWAVCVVGSQAQNYAARWCDW